MTVGLGTGSTAACAVIALGARVRAEGLRLACIATSLETERLAVEQGIPLADWGAVRRFDITIDGADEVDPELRMIKGGGRAFVREKIVAAVTTQEIIIVDDGKLCPALGNRALPVAVFPYGWQSTRDRLAERFGCAIAPRPAPDGGVVVTDDGLYILDAVFGSPLPDPDNLEAAIKEIVGVAEVGLFVGLCQRLIIGYSDGRIEERLP
jgi:ribose 5-phosphate isomerase A